MSLYMETTRIEAERTAQEIAALLGQAGASAIQTEYREKRIIAMSFLVHVQDRQIPFRLPVRVDPIFEYLQRKRSPRTRAKNETAIDQTLYERIEAGKFKALEAGRSGV